LGFKLNGIVFSDAAHHHIDLSVHILICPGYNGPLSQSLPEITRLFLHSFRDFN